MGVRLYPNTQDRAKLELLANVPVGTYDRMDEMEKRHAAELVGVDRFDANDIGYKHYQEREADGAIGTLDAFITFGWGKFRPVSGIGEDYAGSENDIARAAVLLNSNGIWVDVSLTEGVHWC